MMDVYSEWKRSFVLILVICLLTASTVVLSLERAFDRNETIEDLATANAALCVLKKDLEIRYQNGQKFLINNPNGIPGISKALLTQSLDQQAATINALEIVKCKV